LDSSQNVTENPFPDTVFPPFATFVVRAFSLKKFLRNLWPAASLDRNAYPKPTAPRVDLVPFLNPFNRLPCLNESPRVDVSRIPFSNSRQGIALCTRSISSRRPMLDLAFLSRGFFLCAERFRPNYPAPFAPFPLRSLSIRPIRWPARPPNTPSRWFPPIYVALPLGRTVFQSWLTLLCCRPLFSLCFHASWPTLALGTNMEIIFVWTPCSGPSFFCSAKSLVHRVPSGKGKGLPTSRGNFPGHG